MLPTELAYTAALVDNLTILKIRRAGQTQLPHIGLNAAHMVSAMDWMAEKTGTSVTRITKAYNRLACTQHCEEAHQHVDAVYDRWSITGMKATILLWNVRPYMVMRHELTDKLIELGLSVHYKPATIEKMIELGWQLPDTLKESE